MSTYDEMMRKLRGELPSMYNLTGTDAGTGTLSAPKNMTDQQAFDYDDAVRDRMGSGRSDRMEAMMARIRTQAQEENAAKAGKKRPSFFPAKEETSTLKKFLGNLIADESENESGDTGYLPDEGDTGYLPDEGDTGAEGQEAPGTFKFNADNTIANLEELSQATRVGEINPVEKAADVYEPFAGEDVDTTDEYEREEFGMDASEKNYDEEYVDQVPVATSDVVVNGVEYTREEFEDGAVFLVSEDSDQIPLRQGDVKAFEHTFKRFDPFLIPKMLRAMKETEKAEKE